MNYPDFEVILVDNNTSSLLKPYSAYFDNVQLVSTSQKNLGASGGRNLGVKHSRGRYIFFVDDDVIVDKNCLAEIVEIAENNPSIGIVGPLMYSYNNKSQVWFYKEYLSAKYNKEIVAVPIIVSGALLVKVEVIRNIGLFDEAYFVYHEDWDFCYRAQNVGYGTVLATRAKTWHKVPEDESAKLFSPRMAYLWNRNFFIFAGRHKKTINGVSKFLLKQFVYYGNRSFPIYYFPSTIRQKKFGASKAYLHGILDGLVCLGKLLLH